MERSQARLSVMVSWIQISKKKSNSSKIYFLSRLWPYFWFSTSQGSSCSFLFFLTSSLAVCVNLTILWCCPALGIDLPLSHLKMFGWQFSPSQAVVDSFPQAADLRHHPSTAVNIIFFTVKLCTLLNRQAIFFLLEHQPNIKPSSLTVPSTSSSTASWARVSGEAWGVCSQPVLVSWKEQRHRWNKVQYLVVSSVLAWKEHRCR